MNTKKLGQNIKRARNNKGVSQTQLAEMLGWQSGNSRISNYENGTREPSLSDLDQIAKVLDTSIISLLLDPAELPNGVSAEELASVIIAFFSGTDELRQQIKSRLNFDNP